MCLSLGGRGTRFDEEKEKPGPALGIGRLWKGGEREGGKEVFFWKLKGSCDVRKKKKNAGDVPMGRVEIGRGERKEKKGDLWRE